MATINGREERSRSVTIGGTYLDDVVALAEQLNAQSQRLQHNLRVVIRQEFDDLPPEHTHRYIHASRQMSETEAGQSYVTMRVCGCVSYEVSGTVITEAILPGHQLRAVTRATVTHRHQQRLAVIRRTTGSLYRDSSMRPPPLLQEHRPSYRPWS